MFCYVIHLIYDYIKSLKKLFIDIYFLQNQNLYIMYNRLVNSFLKNLIQAADQETKKDPKAEALEPFHKCLIYQYYNYIITPNY